MTILLIDDEPAVARLYGAALQRRGLSVVLSSSGAAGLDMVPQIAPVLIVTDMEMAGMTGSELCRRLRAEGRTHCPVLVLTGHDTAAALSRGLQAGADDFLTKGAKVDMLVERVTFWLASGFVGLPESARTAALLRLQAVESQDAVMDRLALDTGPIETALRVLRPELAALPPGYGSRLLDRIHLLGRITHLLSAQSHTLAHDLRFPDAVAATLARLRFPWVRDMAVLLARFDDFAADARFQQAGEQGLEALAIPA